MLPPKVCPQCGEEYVHAAQSCVHCEVPLVLADPAGDEAPAPALPAVEELTQVRAAAAGWSVALSDLLVEAGIPHRVVPVPQDSSDGPRRGGAAGPFGVYVRAEDAERARALDARLMEREIPDLPEDWEASGPADEDGCPACGAAVPAGAAECPDCGLALG